jgi:hypothetical protein
MELGSSVFSTAGRKRRRSTEEKPGDGKQAMKDSKKAKAQIGSAGVLVQEEK